MATQRRKPGQRVLEALEGGARTMDDIGWILGVGRRSRARIELEEQVWGMAERGEIVKRSDGKYPAHVEYELPPPAAPVVMGGVELQDMSQIGWKARDENDESVAKIICRVCECGPEFDHAICQSIATNRGVMAPVVVIERGNDVHSDRGAAHDGAGIR